MKRIDHVLLSREEIRERVAELGAAIETELDGEELTLLVILQGSIFFAADLMRAISLPIYLESFRVSSYHGGTSSSGRVTFDSTALDDLADKHVLVVDDILDTGRTLNAVVTHLRDEIGVASARSCVLLDKNVERAVEFEADYVGFRIEDEFVVGYGLDYMGKYRNLPLIGVLKNEFIEASS
ncbi:MAG: hypoxanthine phosphoribosyltransferase [Verrucomicrobiales bacterium]|jgi:hypoxanthine phosphoribosyltransferase